MRYARHVTFLFALLCCAACATATSERCQSTERCLRRCENAGTPSERDPVYNQPYSSMTACERQCGNCSGSAKPDPNAKPQGPPTLTGH
jgi:hypothetical protein